MYLRIALIPIWPSRSRDATNTCKKYFYTFRINQVMFTYGERKKERPTFTEFSGKICRFKLTWDRHIKNNEATTMQHMYLRIALIPIWPSRSRDATNTCKKYFYTFRINQVMFTYGERKKERPTFTEFSGKICRFKLTWDRHIKNNEATTMQRNRSAHTAWVWLRCIVVAPFPIWRWKR